MLLPFAVILLISLFTLYQTFSLNLLGDDWLAFFRYFQHLGPESPGQWNHLTYFLTPYGAQDIMMGLMQKIVGYASTWYYFTSFVLRMFAAFSLFPLIFYLTKSKLGSIFAVLFFAVTVTGFDTSNWSSNMTTYITIALFNLFLYYFLKSRVINPFKLFPIAALLYYLAYVTTPIRMHGSLPLIFLLEAFWVIQERNVKTLKKVGIRLAIFIGIFLVIRYTGHSQGPAEEVNQRLGLGIKAMSDMLSTGRFDFIFYPLVIFGSMIIPDFILYPFQVVAKKQLFWSALLPAFLGFITLVALFVKELPVIKLKFSKHIAIGAIFWMLVVILVHQANLTSFNNSQYLILLLVGGFSTILAILLFITFIKHKKTAVSLFLALTWSFLSFFFAWWWVPNSIFPTTYRYLTISAIGISIFLGTVISLGKERKHQISLFASFCIILILQIIATRIYTSNLINSHSQKISQKIWASIPYIPDIGKSKEPIIFYFEGDGTNGGVLHDVITFGFPPHMAILYNLREEDGGIPLPMDDFKQVISAATDGKSLYAYGYPIKPIALERIYAFHLEESDNLINITSEVREKLKDLNKI